MKHIGSYEAKTHLPELLDSVERDLCEVLALAGKPDEANMVGVELLARLAQRGAPAEDQAVVRLRLGAGGGGGRTVGRGGRSPRRSCCPQP